MTKLGLANYFLQWFFVRLTKHQEKRVENFDLKSATILPNGQMGYSGTGKFKIFQWYSIQYWVLPLTGWWSSFIYLNKGPKFKVISKKTQKSQS